MILAGGMVPDSAKTKKRITTYSSSPALLLGGHLWVFGEKKSETEREREREKKVLAAPHYHRIQLLC